MQPGEGEGAKEEEKQQEQSRSKGAGAEQLQRKRSMPAAFITFLASSIKDPPAGFMHPCWSPVDDAVVQALHLRGRRHPKDAAPLRLTQPHTQPRQAPALRTSIVSGVTLRRPPCPLQPQTQPRHRVGCIVSASCRCRILEPTESWTTILSMQPHTSIYTGASSDKFRTGEVSSITSCPIIFPPAPQCLTCTTMHDLHRNA
jgi:hypothetical protein